MNREEAARKNLEGQKLLEVGQYDEAIKLFTEAIKIDANYATPWLNRSDANRKLGREAEADADKEKGESLVQAPRTEAAQQRTVFDGRSPVEAAHQCMIFGGRTRTFRERLIRTFVALIFGLILALFLPRPLGITLGLIFLLVALRQLTGPYEVVIDKAAQSIMVRKPRFWFIPSKRVIPFSAVLGVNAVFHPADQFTQSRWEVHINFRGEKYMETIEIYRAKEEERMHRLASHIEHFIGLHPGH